MTTLSDIIARVRGGQLRMLVTHVGDSTCLRRGYGHAHAMPKALSGYLDKVGTLAGYNYTGSSPGETYCFDDFYRIAGASNDGVIAGLPAALEGGHVVPSGWDGYAPAYLAANANTSANGYASRHMRLDSEIGSHANLVFSVFIKEINETNAGERNGSGGRFEVYSMNSVSVSAGTVAAIAGTGAKVKTATTGTTNTLQRIDVEKKPQDHASNSLRFYTDGVVSSAGPFCGVFISAINKQRKCGFINSWWMAAGGKSVYNAIEDVTTTAYAAESLANIFKAGGMLCHSDYASSFPSGAAFGDATTGGLGGLGASSMIGLVPASFGFNDAVQTGDGFLLATEDSRLVKASTAAGTNNTTVTTFRVASTAAFSSAGHIIVKETGERIKYTSKHANGLDFLGCTRNAFTVTTGTGVATTSANTVMQGYPIYDPRGFAASMNRLEALVRAAWVAAGLPTANFYLAWVRPQGVSETQTVASTVVATNAEREERHSRYADAVALYCPTIVIIDLSKGLRAKSLVRGGNCDVNQPNTIAASATATSPADGGSITLGTAPSSTSGAILWENEIVTWTAISGSDIQNIRRGAYGTVPGTHAINSNCYELDHIHMGPNGYRKAWTGSLAAELAGMELDTEDGLKPAPATRRLTAAVGDGR